MKNKLIAVAILSHLVTFSTLASADPNANSGSIAAVSEAKNSRVVKPDRGPLSLQNGYLNPANNEDFAVIMEHIGYANTTAIDSPMFHTMVTQARAEALMQPTLYTTANTIDPAQQTMHHSLLMPKKIVNTTTNEARLLNTATVNVTGNIVFGYTTVVLKDPSGKQIGLPGARRSYGQEANRALALSEVYSEYIRENYRPDALFTLESVAMTVDESRNRMFHKTTYILPAHTLMNADGQGDYNGSLTIDAPAQTPEHKAQELPNIKVCLNRSNEDCDIPIMYPPNTKNEDLKIKLAMKGRINTDWNILQVYSPGSDDGAEIPGNESGAWIMTTAPGDNGVWASMRNPNNSKTFADYVEISHSIYTDQWGFHSVATQLDWDIPADEAVFGVGASDTNATMFKNASNVQWEIRLKVEAEFTNDADGNIATINDREAIIDPVVTVFVAENADLTDDITDWVLDQKLLPLFFRYSCIAMGTLITLDDGSLKAIEDIIVGDRVSSQGESMLVMDTSIGYEALPMINIQDDKGHSVLLTETHPVVTINRGVVWANEVAVGDILSTDVGQSTVVSVGEELFNGTVHNLELEPLQGKDDANEVMFANGIAVGDLGYQNALTFKDKALTDVETVLKSLPEEWHQDYLNSIK